MVDLRRETGIKDINENMVCVYDIMLNHTWGDLWLVRWWKNKWMLILINYNDGEETELDNVDDFEIVGKFTNINVLKKE